jgi:acetyl esterase/lipase
MIDNAMAKLPSLPSLFFLLAFGPPCLAQPKPAPREQPTPPGFTSSVVEIGHGGGRVLHAKIAAPTKTPDAPMPAVVIIHGGGWAAGSYLSIPYPFVPKRYFIASIEYRLSHEAPWPAQIEDCKLGVRWLRANAAKYHVDPNRIACLGGSAGGHLVACMGTIDSPDLEGDGGYPGVSSKVQAVVDMSGPTDFTQGNFGLGGANIDAKSLARDVGLETAFLGGTQAQKPEVWKQASPITWVRAGDPPFFILQSETDTIVSPRQATTFADALKKAGVPVQLVMIKNAPPKGHSRAGGVPDEATQNDEIHQFLDRYLK